MGRPRDVRGGEAKPTRTYSRRSGGRITGDRLRASMLMRHSAKESLPESLRRRGEALRKRISIAIRQRGPMPFDRYMELALYAPGTGYYTGGLRKFGAEGDFTTAPECSPLFAGCLARQCMQVLHPGDELIEFGAGSGQLAADLLIALDELNSLPERYRIVELSADLRARQQQTLRELAPRYLEYIDWIERLPEHHDGVIIANEVLDAMPVSRFLHTGAGLMEMFVDDKEGKLKSVWHRVQTPGLAAFIEENVPLDSLPIPYLSEVAPRAAAWIDAIGRIPGRRLMLLIDYGYPRGEYYLPERDQGTLMCYFRHQAHEDPLRHPGIQDITAHVDFTAVARAAQAAGMTVAGYTSQANFLLASGLEAQLAKQDPEDTAQWMETVQAVKILTLPSGMGERFRVMALTRGIDDALDGFQLRDLRDRL